MDERTRELLRQKARAMVAMALAGKRATFDPFPAAIFLQLDELLSQSGEPEPEKPKRGRKNNADPE